MSQAERTAPARCPHCGEPMRRWAIPENLPFDEPWHWVCFNDQCPYFVQGWQWMAEQFGRPCSYRHRQNPQTGEYGPLATWSNDALREGILDD